MGKPSRSSRKQKRNRAQRAVERGLPAREVEARESTARGGPGAFRSVASPSRRLVASAASSPEPDRALPVWVKVALGAAAVLLALWGLSQLRKQEPAPPKAPETEDSRGAPSRVDLTPPATEVAPDQAPPDVETEVPVTAPAGSPPATLPHVEPSVPAVERSHGADLPSSSPPKADADVGSSTSRATGAAEPSRSRGPSVAKDTDAGAPLIRPTGSQPRAKSAVSAAVPAPSAPSSATVAEAPPTGAAPANATAPSAPPTTAPAEATP